MDVHPYYGPGNVVIDTCIDCRVLWLDHGELRKIRDAPGRDRVQSHNGGRTGGSVFRPGSDSEERTMSWRRVQEEYEASLYQVPMPRFFRLPKGELEVTRYNDGEKRLEIKLVDAAVPDGSAVSVVIDGIAVCEVLVHRRRGRLEVITASGQMVPEVRSGSVGEIQYGGQVLLRGTFELD
jgi:Zn-finger nucleic acid-binding protein